MVHDLHRRKFLQEALSLIPAFHLIEGIGASAEGTWPQTAEMNIVARYSLLALENTREWFSRHVEHCVNRILWSGSIEDWLQGFLANTAEFGESADGGPGILISRAQMDSLSWQTKACAGQAPCHTRLFVRTMFLIDMTLSNRDKVDHGSDVTFAEALKSNHPTLHDALVVALGQLDINEVLRMVDECEEMAASNGDEQAPPSDYLKAAAPTIRANILSLLAIEGITSNSLTA